MKFLAFLISTLLLAATARAQPASVTNPLASNPAGAAPAWGGVIDKYAKEGVPEPADNTDAKLATETYSEQERATKAGAKGAVARPPAKGASAAAGTVAATAEKSPKPELEDDFSKTIKSTVKDLVKPFQEVLADANAEKKQAEALATPDGLRPQQVGDGAPTGQPKSDYDRKRDTQHTVTMIEELMEELKPWALGAAFIAFLGFCIRAWMSFALRKTQRASSSASRAGPPSGYSAGTPRSHLETDPGRSSSRKSRSRS